MERYIVGEGLVEMLPTVVSYSPGTVERYTVGEGLVEMLPSLIQHRYRGSGKVVKYICSG